MNFILVIFALFLTSSKAIIRCSYDTVFFEECLVYDYTSPNCGPRLDHCPLKEVLYNTFCEVADCVVNILKLSF